MDHLNTLATPLVSYIHGESVRDKNELTLTDLVTVSTPVTSSVSRLLHDLTERPTDHSRQSYAFRGSDNPVPIICLSTVPNQRHE
jgi:hypothetical protein